MEKDEKIIENEKNFQIQIINEDLSLLSVKELVEKINKNVGEKKSYTNDFNCLIVELARKYGKGGKVYDRKMSFIKSI